MYYAPRYWGLDEGYRYDIYGYSYRHGAHGYGRGKRHHRGVAGTDVDAGAVTGDYEELGRRTLNAAPSCVYLSLAAAGKQPCSRRQNFGFTLKPRQSIGIIREGLRQHLQRHIPIELGVSRPIYLAL